MQELKSNYKGYIHQIKSTMKQLILLVIILTSYNCYAQHNADAIIGRWLKIPKEDLIIEVYKVKDEYKGKITWSKNNDKTKPTGFVILDELRYNSKSKKWENGKIHDPNSSRTYTASAKIKSDGTLEVSGYMGMKFLGTKKYFKRIK